jgi:dihydrofolate reductase
MINAIFACDTFGGIGNRGTLPWPNHSGDMAWFREHTQGDIVVMGRATWDDPKMPKPLPNRINVVITNRMFAMRDVVCYNKDWQQRVRDLSLRENRDVWIIGGKKILDQSRDMLDRIYMTRMKGKYYTDVSLDINRYLLGWRPVTVRPGDNCTFEIWKNSI